MKLEYGVMYVVSHFLSHVSMGAVLCVETSYTVTQSSNRSGSTMVLRDK